MSDYAKYWCFKCPECGSLMPDSMTWNGYHKYYVNCCKNKNDVYHMFQFLVELHGDGNITSKSLKDGMLLDVVIEDIPFGSSDAPLNKGVKHE